MPTRKLRLTVYIPVQLLERARNAVYWSGDLTLAGLVQHALEKHLNHVETKGRAFPQRHGKLKSGRPRKKPL